MWWEVVRFFERSESRANWICCMIKRDKPKMTSRFFSQATRRAGLSLPYIRKTMGSTGFGGKMKRLVSDTLSVETPLRHLCWGDYLDIQIWSSGERSRLEVKIQTSPVCKCIWNDTPGWDLKAWVHIRQTRLGLLSPEPANVRMLERRRKANQKKGRREKKSG